MTDWADVIFTGQLFLAIAFINLYARNVLSAVNYLLQFLRFSAVGRRRRGRFGRSRFKAPAPGGERPPPRVAGTCRVSFNNLRRCC